MTTVTASSSPQSLATAAGNVAAAKLSGDFNMFLKLLTTQMQNQDPLDPMDTSEYTQQLVQYSQVEQTIQQTETLKDILASLSTQAVAQASAFIGREAQFDSAVAGLSSASPAQWSYAAERPVASLAATITDAAGKVVDTRTLDPASAGGRFAWDGKLANGGRAPDGSYTLSLTALDSAGDKVPVAIRSLGTVSEVVSGDGGVKLGVNGAQLPASTLLRVSAPAG